MHGVAKIVPSYTEVESGRTKIKSLLEIAWSAMPTPQFQTVDSLSLQNSHVFIAERYTAFRLAIKNIMNLI